MRPPLRLEAESAADRSRVLARQLQIIGTLRMVRDSGEENSGLPVRGERSKSPCHASLWPVSPVLRHFLVQLQDARLELTQRFRIVRKSRQRSIELEQSRLNGQASRLTDRSEVVVVPPP